MVYFMKPFPEEKVDVSGWTRFIQNEWFNKNFMVFVYALQAILLVLPFLFGWMFSSLPIRLLTGVSTFLVHELLHILCIFNRGDISITHSGIFFWIHSNAVMTKWQFWLFMTLPFLGLTVLPLVILPFVSEGLVDFLLFVAWLNAVIAGADILNSILILSKPRKAKFYRGYYIVEK